MFRQIRPLKGPKFAPGHVRSGIGNGPINFEFNSMRNAKRKSAAADKNDNLSNDDDLALASQSIGSWALAAKKSVARVT